MWSGDLGMMGLWMLDIFCVGVCCCGNFCGKGRAEGTGPPHLLGVLIGHLIAWKDGLGSMARCAG